LTCHPLARAKAVPMGCDAAPLSGNVQHPATAQPPRRTHLDQDAIAARIGYSQIHISRLQRRALTRMRTQLVEP
jgi:hypothetical protein